MEQSEDAVGGEPASPHRPLAATPAGRGGGNGPARRRVSAGKAEAGNWAKVESPIVGFPPPPALLLSRGRVWFCSQRLPLRICIPAAIFEFVSGVAIGDSQLGLGSPRKFFWCRRGRIVCCADRGAC